MTVWNFGMYKSDTRTFANEYDKVVKAVEYFELENRRQHARMVDFDSDTLSKILISEEVYRMLLNHFCIPPEMDSRDVAKTFQMEHYNLLRKIEKILEDEVSEVVKTEGHSTHPKDEGSNSPKDYTQSHNDLAEDEGSNSPKDYAKHFRRERKTEIYDLSRGFGNPYHRVEGFQGSKRESCRYETILDGSSAAPIRIKSTVKTKREDI
jgi:hypothetical protein